MNKSDIKRPVFRRSQAHKIKRISRTGYRRPKGVHNKVKDQKRGHHVMISTGYGYPVSLRNKTNEGLTIVHVETIAQLEGLKNSTIIVSGTLGKRKKIALLKVAQEKNIPVYNVADVSAEIKTLEDFKVNRKKATEEKIKKRQSKKDAAVAAKEGKKVKPKKEEQAETKKETEKKEQDKVLITKE